MMAASTHPTRSSSIKAASSLPPASTANPQPTAGDATLFGLVHGKFVTLPQSLTRICPQVAALSLLPSIPILVTMIPYLQTAVSQTFFQG
jgi:hypothetical protein